MIQPCRGWFAASKAAAIAGHGEACRAAVKRAARPMVAEHVFPFRLAWDAERVDRPRSARHNSALGRAPTLSGGNASLTLGLDRPTCHFAPRGAWVVNRRYAALRPSEDQPVSTRLRDSGCRHSEREECDYRPHSGFSVCLATFFSRSAQRASSSSQRASRAASLNLSD